MFAEIDASKWGNEGRKEKSSNPIWQINIQTTNAASYDNDGGRKEGGGRVALCGNGDADGPTDRQTDTDCIWAKTKGDVCQTVLSPYSTAR